jgi:hypothetical protein
MAVSAGTAQDTAPRQDPVVKFGTTVVMSSGLRGDLYFIPVDTTKLPNFRKLKPVGSIYTLTLNVPPHEFSQGFPGVTDRFEWFAIDYTGRFWIKEPGAYRFALESDDGARLYIDGRTVINNDGQHPPQTREGEAKLKSGIHQIRVSYFQGPRFHVALVLAVSQNHEKWRVFNMDDFKPPDDLDVTAPDARRRR